MNPKKEIPVVVNPLILLQVRKFLVICDDQNNEDLTTNMTLDHFSQNWKQENNAASPQHWNILEGGSGDTKHLAHNKAYDKLENLKNITSSLVSPEIWRLVVIGHSLIKAAISIIQLGDIFT